MRLIPFPVLCNYYVTYRCNATCSFCDIWEKPSPYITLENAERNLQDLKKLGVKIIDFTGGEPLLHRQIHELLALAKKYGFLTTLTTNGLLYPKFAEKLAGKIDMLHFSLDYYEKEKHNAARGVACYDFVMESIQIARNLGEKPDILMTVFEENLDQIPLIWEKITVPNDLILILNPVFDYNQVRTGKSLSTKYFETMRFWAKKQRVYLNEAFLVLRENGGNHTEKPICKAASSTIVISPSNELVLPCYHLGLQNFPIENRLYELYRSAEVQNLVKKEGRYEACEGCAINCYMQPSFAVELNKYWFKALPSTLKYNIWKKMQ